MQHAWVKRAFNAVFRIWSSRFLVENIEKLGWDKPTPIQTLVIPKALEGADILGGAPTGTGKSAAFLLPVIARLSLEKSLVSEQLSSSLPESWHYR